MTTDEWSCLISFSWDPLSRSEQAGIEKIKMKIYVSSEIRTNPSLYTYNRSIALSFFSSLKIREETMIPQYIVYSFTII